VCVCVRARVCVCGCCTSSAAYLSTAVKGASSGTDITRKGSLGSDVRVILKETFDLVRVAAVVSANTAWKRRVSERATVLDQRHNASPNDRGLYLSHWSDPSQFVLIYHSTSGVRRETGVVTTATQKARALKLF
jgi:hypothetical protein